MIKLKTTDSSNFFEKIAGLLKNARKSLVQTVNQTMVYTYFEIGKTIVEEEQKAKTLSAEFKLSWSHYIKLIRIDTEEERKFYELESIENKNSKKNC